MTADEKDRLRDALAMAAMQGLFSASNEEFWVYDELLMRSACDHAYEWADEMLEARGGGAAGKESH